MNRGSGVISLLNDRWAMKLLLAVQRRQGRLGRWILWFRPPASKPRVWMILSPPATTPPTRHTEGVRGSGQQ